MYISFGSRKRAKKYKNIFVKKVEETIVINGIKYTLEDIEKDCWVRLLNGAVKSRDPLHTPAVANLQEEGIAIRTVVLRAANTINKELTFHTDVRSVKWNNLKKNAETTWHFYDANARVQIRASGTATLHHNDLLADIAWSKTNASSRKTYLSFNAPSTKSVVPSSGLLPEFDGENPSLEISEMGRKNFGVVVTKINWLEWLWLNSKGNMRAEFKYNKEEIIQANWLIP